jgi:hypothetical protein
VVGLSSISCLGFPKSAKETFSKQLSFTQILTSDNNHGSNLTSFRIPLVQLQIICSSDEMMHL